MIIKFASEQVKNTTLNPKKQKQKSKIKKKNKHKI